MDFSPSPLGAEYLQRVRTFMREHIEPIEDSYHKELDGLDDPWVVLPIIEELKERARAEGLWNLFFPDDTYGVGLTNADYALVAEQTGRSAIAPEIFNCNAPDTGNMEVLIHFGSDAQREQWLTPLHAGRIRSAFCMTEPDVASSDATNMRATATVEGDEVVINGTKWWSTGIGHPNCELIVFMGLSDPDAPRHRQHSMVLVPRSHPGVSVERMLNTFGYYDEPYGHGVVRFDNVRVPVGNIVQNAGDGFKIAQGRLGPGRVHHCMRAIGMAERALELMIDRSVSREAFGRPLAKLGANPDHIARSRIEIDQARLLTLRTAWLLDTQGIKGALSEVSQIKAHVPEMLCNIVDRAIQMHGGGGMSDDFPLARMYAGARSLRLADGPDEVHRARVAKIEVKKRLNTRR